MLFFYLVALLVQGHLHDLDAQVDQGDRLLKYLQVPLVHVLQVVQQGPGNLDDPEIQAFL